MAFAGKVFHSPQCRGLDAEEPPTVVDVDLEPPSPRGGLKNAPRPPDGARAPCSPREAPFSFQIVVLFVFSLLQKSSVARRSAPGLFSPPPGRRVSAGGD
jgi:hypothetical protein